MIVNNRCPVIMFHKNSPVMQEMVASSNQQTIINNISLVCDELTIWILGHAETYQLS